MMIYILICSEIFDYEDKQTYLLYITAQHENGLSSDPAMTAIQIINDNDNAPVYDFHPCGIQYYRKSYPESSVSPQVAIDTEPIEFL